MPPGYPRPESSSASSFLWAFAPLFTCGAATPFTMGYAALRLKSKLLAASALVYAFGWLVMFYGVAVSSQEDLSPAVPLLAVLGVMGNLVGGTIHSFAIRSKVFGLIDSTPPRTPNEHAVAVAKRRRELREQARRLAEQDPSMAWELRIGRPDLPRTYDDGGLVDVNHAPAEAIATLPGMTRELAAKVVETRDVVGTFVSAEDLSATVGLPPNITGELAEYTIFLT
jgi:hypothetical protein